MPDKCEILPPQRLRVQISTDGTDFIGGYLRTWSLSFDEFWRLIDAADDLEIKAAERERESRAKACLFDGDGADADDDDNHRSATNA
jgi:hypothetical protein